MSTDSKILAGEVARLEQRVNELARELKINSRAWRRFMKYLEALKFHNARMYAHSLRVGIYAQGMADYEGWKDSKFPFFGGCGHDYGKCLISNRILNSKHFTPDKYEKVKQHAYIGFEGLKDKFLFTAFIAGLHHRYQLGGESNYGIDLKKDSPIPLSEETVSSIHQTAELVALADFFDALTTRKNDKGLIAHPDDIGEARAVMLKYFEPWSSRVEWLFEHRLNQK